MIKALINKEKRVLRYYGTDMDLVEVEMDELPKPPENPKIGINYVAYFNSEARKVELHEETRPLTEAEESAKKQAELESQVLSLMEVLADIHEGGGA